MEVIMNGKTVQYNMDFRKEYPDIFKVLSDEEHYIYHVENIESDDIIIFLSANSKISTNIEMSEFEKYLRKLNKKIFFNLGSIFSDSFETEDESNEVLSCKVISRNDFLKEFKTNYRFQRINMFIKDKTFLFYVSPESEIGEIYDYEKIKKRERFLKTLSEYNPDNKSKIFYDLLKKEIIIINASTGQVKSINEEKINLEQEYLQDFAKICQPWTKTNFCDARKFLKVCKDKEREVEECNIYIEDNVLYVCFVSNYENFKNLAEVAKFLYNNQNEAITKKIQEVTGGTDFIYLSNSNRKDCILYRKENVIKAIPVEKLGLTETCSDIISAFNSEDIVNMIDLKVPYLLSISLLDSAKIPQSAISTSKYQLWADFFSKTLYCVERN